MDKILSFLGMMRKAQAISLGTQEATAACQNGRAKLLLLASDAAPSARRSIKFAAEAGELNLLVLPYTKEELGQALGKTGCAALSVNNTGFARSLIDKLEQTQTGTQANHSTAKGV